MNPDLPIDPRSALEASLTALLLGELPHDQAAALHQKLAQDAELAALYERLKHTIALVRETVAQPVEKFQEPLIPLRISEQRRQKLLAQFKTAAPQQLAATPRRPVFRWWVPVGIAAVCMMLLSSLLLPSLSRTKGGRTFSAMWGEEQSASRPASALGLPKGGRPSEPQSQNLFVERYAVKDGDQPAAPPPPVPPIPESRPVSPVASAIVLPQVATANDDAVAGAPIAAPQKPITASGRVAHYYDDFAGGRSGGSGGGAYGGFAAAGRGRSAAPESSSTVVASASPSDAFYASPGATRGEAEGRQAGLSGGRGVLSRGTTVQDLSAGIPMTAPPPAAPEPAAAPAPEPAHPLPQLALPAGSAAMPKDAPEGAVVVAGDAVQSVNGAVQAGNLTINNFGKAYIPPATAIEPSGDASHEEKFAWGDTSKKRIDSLALGQQFDSRYGLSPGKQPQQKETLNLGFAVAGVPMAPAQSSLGAPATKFAPAQDEQAGRPVNQWYFGAGTTDADADALKYQWDKNASVASNHRLGEAQQVPILGDVPNLGRFYRQSSSEVAAGEKAKIEERVESFDRAYAEPKDQLQSADGRKADGKTVGDLGLYSLNTSEFGLAKKPAKGTEVTTPAPARRARSNIALPSGSKADTTLTVTKGVPQKPQMQITDGIDGETPAMSAETLRRVDQMRVETTRELARQQAASDRAGRVRIQPGSERAAGAAVATEVNRADAELAASEAKVRALSNSLVTLDAMAHDDDLKAAPQARAYFDAKADLAQVKKAAEAPVPQPEVQTSENAFSTFSLNVSDVSLKLAQASLEKGVMPDVASLRSEEFLNAFNYRDPEPATGVPVAFAWERAQNPFAQGRDLLRFSVKTAALGRTPGRPLNLVLLLDNSGSMERADRVQIIREALRVLATQLGPQDKFSVVTFSRTARLWVDGVPGNQAGKAAEEVGSLTPQGGTNLEEAMNLAYKTALRHYLANGINRVVLLTDGAANLGNVEPESLKARVEANRKQGVAFDCFGIGWEGYNDDLLEVLSRNGDGRYGFVNTPEEAATEFAGQLAGALHVAASDVKVQVEFNPARTTAYRQVGYAKHQLKKEQFRDNTVDAAEIAAAESGNALYVIAVNPAGQGPIATVRVRYKVPGTSDYHEHEWAVPYEGNAVALEQASPAMRLAVASSAFAEWLASSPYAGEVTPDRLLKYLAGVPEVYGADQRPKKLEWMIRQAKSVAGR